MKWWNKVKDKKPDLGVWVCGFPFWIDPFMEAFCYKLGHTHIPIKHTRPSNQNFRSAMLPVAYGRRNQVQDSKNHFHLFAIGETAIGTFENECTLNDWRFPVPVAGFVVVLARELFEGASESREHVPNKKDLTDFWPIGLLHWVKSHELPFVIAAFGYERPDCSEAEFSKKWELGTRALWFQGQPLTLTTLGFRCPRLTLQKSSSHLKLKLPDTQAHKRPTGRVTN